MWLFLVAGVVALSGQSDAHKSTGRDYKAERRAFHVANPIRGNGLFGIFLYFAKAGMFVFGSGLAVVPFLYGGVVQEHHWLTDRQFVDAVAVAMITPGPVVITVAFIGYLVAGHIRSNSSSGRNFLPRLFSCRVACAILQTLGQKSPAECIRPRCNGGSNWGHRRGRDRTGATLDL